jgi:hypothetical protein
MRLDLTDGELFSVIHRLEDGMEFSEACSVLISQFETAMLLEVWQAGWSVCELCGAWDAVYAHLCPQMKEAGLKPQVWECRFCGLESGECECYEDDSAEAAQRRDSQMTADMISKLQDDLTKLMNRYRWNPVSETPAELPLGWYATLTGQVKDIHLWDGKGWKGGQSDRQPEYYTILPPDPIRRRVQWE